jgi:tetratricopeptide (TPR) repeat protein
MIRPTLNLAALCCFLTAPLVALAEPPQPVIPPTAARPLERALGEDLGRGLALQKASIDSDHVVLSYGPKADGPSTTTFTLRHPSVTQNAAHVGEVFSIHTSPTVAKGSVTRLVERLAGLKLETFWFTPAPPTVKAGPTPEPETADRQGEADDALRLALHAARIDDHALAQERLAAMEKDGALRAASGLDLVEAWYEVGDKERGAKAAVEFLKSEEILEPMDAIRGGILKGQPLTVEDLLAVLARAKHDCKVGAIGSSLNAVGRRADGHELLEHLFEKEGCMEAALERIAWYVADHDFPNADALSETLIEKFPESEEAIGRRAQVLMALKRPLDAVTLLEPVVWKNPHSGLLSALLGAYNRVSDHAWQDAKRNEIVAKAAANAQDYTAGFYAGVLLHYDGQFAASNLQLEPLLKVFGEQPRLFIYLGMNAFNLGDTEGAFALLKRGEDLEAPDPDIYYCRAEVNRFTDPKAAAEDLRRYLAQTRGSPTSNPKKRARVETMAQTLAVCLEAGGPIPCPGPWEHPYGHPANEPPPEPEGTVGIPEWAAILGFLVLAGAAVLLARRRAASRA